MVLAAVGLTALISIGVTLLKPREPEYQGRPLGYWYRQARSGEASRGEVTSAFRAMGPASVPFLLRELRRQDSFSARAYRSLWPYIPMVLQRGMSMPQPRDDVLFFWVAQLLGPSAPPQQLGGLLSDRNPEIRLATLWALMGEPKATQLPLSAVDHLLHDSQADVRASAALLLGRLAADRSEIVPLLAEALRGRSVRPFIVTNVKVAAPDIFARLGPAARTTVPDLRKLLQEPEVFVRVPAAIALWHIDRDTNVIPNLVLDLRRASTNRSPEDAWVCDRILSAISDIGPPAEPVGPVIRDLLEHPKRSWPGFHRTNLVAKARQALRKVYPEVGLEEKIEGGRERSPSAPLEP